MTLTKEQYKKYKITRKEFVELEEMFYHIVYEMLTNKNSKYYNDYELLFFIDPFDSYENNEEFNAILTKDGNLIRQTCRNCRSKDVFIQWIKDRFTEQPEITDAYIDEEYPKYLRYDELTTQINNLRRERDALGRVDYPSYYDVLDVENRVRRHKGLPEIEVSEILGEIDDISGRMTESVQQVRDVSP